MKIIKSFLIVTAGFCAATVSYAQQQQLKTDNSKPAASTVSPPGTRPVLAPDVKPEAKNTTPLKQSEQTEIAAPSPLTREEQVTAPQVKPTLKIVDEKVSTTEPLSAENLKTLNGTAERPKQTAPLTNDQAPKPIQITAPAVKVKENK
jgi:hypothetical protein